MFTLETFKRISSLTSLELVKLEKSEFFLTIKQLAKKNNWKIYRQFLFFGDLVIEGNVGVVYIPMGKMFIIEYLPKVINNKVVVSPHLYFGERGITTSGDGQCIVNTITNVLAKKNGKEEEILFPVKLKSQVPDPSFPGLEDTMTLPLWEELV